ncbi:MAG: Resolvase domain protein, partial [Actinomycetia bacterium]|nr:Resolvase domain protein [Actinomycetes bacterium]
MKREGLAEAATKAGITLVACLYGRVSNDSAGDRQSVGEQDIANKRACVDKKWKVGGNYADNDKSASRFARTGRPGWDQLIEDLAEGRYHILILWEASRGDRRLDGWVRLLNLCREMGIWIHITSHGHTYDVRKRREYKTLAEEGLDSSDESEKVSGRVQRSAARAYAAVGGHTPVVS